MPEDKTTKEKDDETIEQVKIWVRQEQFYTLLTRSVAAIGVVLIIGLLLLGVIRMAPDWYDKIMALF